MLKKIVTEKYGKRQIDEVERGGWYFINEVIGGLRDYISETEKTSCYRGNDLFYKGEIPSIPGGKISVRECNAKKEEKAFNNIVSVVVSFKYLEDAPKEDLEFVRGVLKKVGLEPIVNK